MPEFINNNVEESPGISPEQLSAESAALPTEEPSLVDEIRAEERQKEEAEKPLILGQYRSEAEAKAEFDRLRKQQEDANRRLEEFNKSERVRLAREQDLQEQQQREKARLERSQRSREVRRLAGDLMEKGQLDEAAELMEAYHAQNAAYIAKAMLDEALKPIQQQLTQYQMKEAEEQFINHPDLQDIKHYSKQATRLLSEGWEPAKIVGFLREVNSGSGNRTAAAEDNIVDMPSTRAQTRRAAQSLSPGGSTAGPRRSAMDQERLLENAQRKRFLEETLGPLRAKR